MTATKDMVMRILSDADDYVSGERISETLKISRAAVNSAVKALREDGCEILSSTNRGYLLRTSPDSLTSSELCRWLPENRMERVICLPTVDSTNKYLRGLDSDGGAEDGTAVLANEQTAGRGRLGRSFSSDSGMGIYLSYLMRPGTTPAQTAPVTAMTAVIVRDAIAEVCGLECGIKWVNDIVCGGKKLCGILTEMSLEGESGAVRSVVVGIGININQSPADFSPELRTMAASIRQFSENPFRRAKLAAAVITGLDRLRGDLSDESRRGEYIGRYRAGCVTLGSDVRVVRGSSDRLGFARDIDQSFGLVVSYADGSVENVSSGEVSVRGMYGYV